MVFKIQECLCPKSWAESLILTWHIVGDPTFQADFCFLKQTIPVLKPPQFEVMSLPSTLEFALEYDKQC